MNAAKLLKPIPPPGLTIFRLLAAATMLTVSLTAMAKDDSLFHLAGTQAYRPPKDTVEILPTVEIGENDGRVLNATIFRPRNLPAGLMPAIIFIHGGGWRSGSHYNTFSAWMAERGYLVASIDYRLSKEAKWPAQIKDCKLGVRWLRANAQTYHIDPDRIGTWGTSAGGHLAACVGVMQDIPELEGEVFEGVSSRVQAVGVFCGPSDFSTWHTHPNAVALFEKTYEEDPDLWKSASPALAVQNTAPPFHIVHGEADKAVPFSQAEALRDALEKAGHSVEWVPVKNGGHDFFLHATSPETTLDPSHEVIMRGLLEFFDNNLRGPAPNSQK